MKLSFSQKKVVAFILLLACINLFMGCHHYYRPVAMNTTTAEAKQSTLKRFSEQNRYFILRKGHHSYALTNIVIDQANMTLTANVGEVPIEHRLYLSKKSIVNTNYIYEKGKLEDLVLTEVHIFTGDTSVVANISTPYTISLADVQKIERIDFDKQKTTSSHVWGTVGITLGVTLGVALIVLIIALATYNDPPPQPTTTTGSCPYISSFNGQGYELQGEIYSAALYASLQKDDYLPLAIQPINDEYRIKISNELQEIQHTDFADLLVVEHDKNIRMLMDPRGKPHSIAAPQLPVLASLNNNIEVTDQLVAKDNNSCIFKDNDGSRETEDLYVTFKNQAKNKNGKLILSAKSSSWLIHLYNEFTKGFGSHYDKWIKEQEKRPGAELEKWADDQHIPLTVSVKTSNGWKEVQKIKSIGPLLTRDVVIPVELTGDEITQFKISGGYLFWELDYAAIDYSPDTDFKVQTIKPYEAMNEKGENVLPVILNADKIYLDQPNIGDSTVLKYKSIVTKEGMTHTVFLHSSGYYKHIRHYSGSPKVAFLKSFNQPGAFSAFSRQKYAEAWNSIATAKN